MSPNRYFEDGTKQDGEYLPFASSSPRMIVTYLTAGLYIPVLAVFRFLALAPVGCLFPSVRRWAYAHGSSLIIDPSYLRPEPSPREYRVMRLQEALVFLWCLAITVIVATVGRWPSPFVIQAYLTAVCIITLNNVA